MSLTEILIYLASIAFIGISAYKMGHMDGWDKGIQDGNKLRNT